LSASNITLRRDGEKFLSMSEGYHWPASGGAAYWVGGNSSDRTHHKPTWVTAVGVVVGVLGAVAVLVGVVLLLRRRNRRRKSGGWCGKSSGKIGMSSKGAGQGSTYSGGVHDGEEDIEADQVCATRSEIRRGDLGHLGEAGDSSKGTGTDLRLSTSKTIDSAHSLTEPDVRRSLDSYASGGTGAGEAGAPAVAVAARVDNAGVGLNGSPKQQQSPPHDLQGWNLEVLCTVQEDGAGGWGEGSSSQAGWQRVHHLISTMSQNLQQRRLQASLPGTSPSLAQSGSQRSSYGLGSNPCDMPEGDQSVNGALGAATGPLDVITRSCSGSSTSGGVPQLQLLGIIGRGTFAMVYRALWRGCLVAVKVLHLPASGISGQGEEDNRLMSSERMAVMEAVISTNMSHPNIVQVSSKAGHVLFHALCSMCQL
jgi:hypothetical protein